MTAAAGAVGLERGYRRLLACYPARFRTEHGEELVAVLMAGARDGQQRPGLAESASLLRSALGMRLRPDTSPAAGQGWADALAAFSLAGPLFLLATTVLAALTWPYAYGHAYLTAPLGLPDFWVTLSVQAVLAALVLAGLRRAAVVLTAAAGVCSLTFFRWSPEVLPLAISVCILELAALAGSPGPRRGRDLVHWGHGIVLLLCAAAVASYTAQLRQAPREDPLVTLLLTVIVVAALASLAKALRLSRNFRLLLAALACPCALPLASRAPVAGYGLCRCGRVSGSGSVPSGVPFGDGFADGVGGVFLEVVLAWYGHLELAGPGAHPLPVGAGEDGAWVGVDEQFGDLAG